MSLVQARIAAMQQQSQSTLNPPSGDEASAASTRKAKRPSELKSPDNSSSTASTADTSSVSTIKVTTSKSSRAKEAKPGRLSLDEAFSRNEQKSILEAASIDMKFPGSVSDANNSKSASPDGGEDGDDQSVQSRVSVSKSISLKMAPSSSLNGTSQHQRRRRQSNNNDEAAAATAPTASSSDKQILGGSAGSEKKSYDPFDDDPHKDDDDEFKSNMDSSFGQEGDWWGDNDPSSPRKQQQQKVEAVAEGSSPSKTPGSAGSSVKELVAKKTPTSAKKSAMSPSVMDLIHGPDGEESAAESVNSGANNNIGAAPVGGRANMKKKKMAMKIKASDLGLDMKNADPKQIQAAVKKWREQNGGGDDGTPVAIVASRSTDSTDVGVESPAGKRPAVAARIPAKGRARSRSRARLAAQRESLATGDSDEDSADDDHYRRSSRGRLAEGEKQSRARSKSRGRLRAASSSAETEEKKPAPRGRSVGRSSRSVEEEPKRSSRSKSRGRNTTPRTPGSQQSRSRSKVRKESLASSEVANAAAPPIAAKDEEQKADEVIISPGGTKRSASEKFGDMCMSPINAIKKAMSSSSRSASVSNAGVTPVDLEGHAKDPAKQSPSKKSSDKKSKRRHSLGPAKARKAGVGSSSTTSGDRSRTRSRSLARGLTAGAGGVEQNDTEKTEPSSNSGEVEQEEGGVNPKFLDRLREVGITEEQVLHLKRLGLILVEG